MSNRFSPAFKQAIYCEASDLYREWYGYDHMKRGSCLYWSFTLGAVLLTHGIDDIQLQAGDLEWPMAPDRGKNMTHFGYTWSPDDPQSKELIERGQLPEVHVWIRLSESADLIDFSVQWLPQQARTFGYTWETERPPAFLWVWEKRLPAGVIYTARPEAIAYVKAMRMRELRTEGFI